MKFIFRAAAFGRTVTDQIFIWFQSDNAEQSLKEAGLTLPKGLTAEHVYLLIHVNLPGTYDISFESDGQPTEFMTKLLAAMFPGLDVAWILHAGCYFGFMAMICAMLECFHEKDRKFEGLLTEVFRQLPEARLPEDVTVQEVPAILQELLHTVPKGYLALFDDAITSAKNGQAVRIVSTIHGWITGMHKAQITLNLVEGKFEGMEEVTIRRSMAVAFTNAVIGVSDRCATHQYDLQDGNLLRNVKNWMGAPGGWIPGSSFYKQHIKSEEFIDNETTPRHKAHEYSMAETARPGLHIEKLVEVEVVLSKNMIVMNGRKMFEAAQKVSEGRS